MILVGALYACQLQWLIFGLGLFLIAGLRKSYKPIVAALLIYIIENVDAILLFLPKISIFSGLSWNWQGKILELSLSLLIVYGFKWLTPQQVGLHLPKRKLVFLYVTIWGAIFVAGIVKFAIGHGYPLPMHPSLETILYQSTMPGLAEEALYRGVYLAILNNYFGRQWSVLKVKFGWGLVFVTLLFVLMHMIHYDRVINQIVYDLDIIDIVQLLTIGLALAVIREKSGSIWPCVVFHNICNVGVYLGSCSLG